MTALSENPATAGKATIEDFAGGRGGGVPYHEHPRSRRLRAEARGAVLDPALIDAILPLVDGLPTLLRAGADVAALDVTETYDVITAFHAIHDQPSPGRVLSNIHRALRPGGVFLMVEIQASSRLQDNVGEPLAPFCYTVSTMHCMPLSAAQQGSGPGTVRGRQLATSMIADAGFPDIRVAQIESDVFNNYYIAIKR